MIRIVVYNSITKHYNQRQRSNRKYDFLFSCPNYTDFTQTNNEKYQNDTTKTTKKNSTGRCIIGKLILITNHSKMLKASETNQNIFGGKWSCRKFLSISARLLVGSSCTTEEFLKAGRPGHFNLLACSSPKFPILFLRFYRDISLPLSFLQEIL